jgi:hypothetical protein
VSFFPRPQLEVLGQEIQLTFSGLVASLGGSPDTPPQKAAGKPPRWAFWRNWRARATKTQEQETAEAKTPTSEAGNDEPATSAAARSDLSDNGSMGRSVRTSEAPSLEPGSPRVLASGVSGPGPERTWSLPHLKLNLLSGLGAHDERSPGGHLRQGAAAQGTRSEGNTPRPQRGGRNSGVTQRVIFEIEERIAAVERDEWERAERVRERRLSHEWQGGGNPRKSMELGARSRGGGAAPGGGGWVEVVVVKGGELEMGPRAGEGMPHGPAAGEASGSGRMSPSSSSSSGSLHGGQNETLNEVSIQGGAVPDVPPLAGGQAGSLGAGAASAEACEEGDRGNQGAGPAGGVALMSRETSHKKGASFGGSGLEGESAPDPETQPASEEAATWQDAGSSDDTDVGAPDFMAGPTLRERRQRALAGLQRRYEAVIAGLIAAKRAEPDTPLLSSEALLHFNALIYSMRLLMQELEKMEKAVRELRQVRQRGGGAEAWRYTRGCRVWIKCLPQR